MNIYLQNLILYKLYFMSQKKNSSLQILLKSSIFGAIRGLIGLPFEHPFDTLKTNMQATKTKSSIIQISKYIYLNKGFFGFYSGFIVNATRIMAKQLYRWPLMVSLTDLFQKKLAISQIYSSFYTGFSISTIQVGILTPFERVKVWLMTSQKKASIRYFFQKESRTLFKGLFPVFIKQNVSWITFLVSTSYFKNLAKDYYKAKTLNSYQIFLVSIPVSFVNTLFVMPIDFIKTQYQKNSSTVQKNILEIVKENHRNYGVKVFYIGWKVKLIQYTINSIFTVGILDYLMEEYKQT